MANGSLPHKCFRKRAPFYLTLTEELPAAAGAKVFMPRNMYLVTHWGASESETTCQLF